MPSPFDLVIGVALFIAAGRQIFVAQFVNDHLERRVVDVCDAVSVADFVLRFRIEHEVAHDIRRRRFPVHGRNQALAPGAIEVERPARGRGQPVGLLARAGRPRSADRS